MSFSETLEQEACVANILSETDVMSSVSTLRRVCEACIGPHACCHFIYSDVGGHVTVTSAAERLFSVSQVVSDLQHFPF